MTNTPARSTPFGQLIEHIIAGNIVKVGDWTISNGQAFDPRQSLTTEIQRFAATLENEKYHAGEGFQGMIALKPSEKENLSGLKVDLTVEIHAKLESHFEGVGFTIPTRRATQRSDTSERVTSLTR